MKACNWKSEFAPARRRARRRISLAVAAALTIVGASTGCRKPVFFPTESLPAPDGAPAGRAYDTDGDGRGDYFTFRDAAGRVRTIGYDRTGDGTCDERIDLDAVKIARCRHLVLILDGVGFDLVREAYEAGHLRLFHPPSRVVAPYPSLTDLCFEDFFDYVPCRAFEAEYYDHRRGRLAGGSWDYLTGRNAPYNRLLDYRADLILDAVSYLLPWRVFGKEINDSKRLFDRGLTREVLAYYVSSAGVGTKRGSAGHRDCLRKVEQLANQVVWETRGLTKVTLLADHGHSYTPARRIGLEDHLKARGWRLVERLGGPRDAAYVRFGLETYASFATQDPAALSADLVTCEGVELASFTAGEDVVVLAPGGARAVIRRRAGRFAYDARSGDPLRLRGVLGKLRADGEGFYAADDLLAATAVHEYPAPLQRLWRAHFGLVEDPPDVIVSLADEFYSGSQGFARFAKVASTHGGLNYRNSTTFILSTAGPLPAVMRSRDVPKHMSKLLGRDWPGGK